MLRRLLVGGPMAAMFRSKVLENNPRRSQLRARKPVIITAVALVNEIARTVFGPSCGAQQCLAACSSTIFFLNPSDHATYCFVLRPVLIAVAHGATGDPGLG
jgi:hypothetical protein